jgi:hypothetical protein
MGNDLSDLVLFIWGVDLFLAIADHYTYTHRAVMKKKFIFGNNIL